mmetsp:Transcript_89133/g.260569  ORF Transcript_89133/g.260569 Transcript_89133/m.260569 type:complete len:380 (-) Transcript_89133:210-1349(-)
MKVVVQTAKGEAMDFDLDSSDSVATLKCLIESVNPDLGPADTYKFTLNGKVLPDDDSSFGDVQYREGDVMFLGEPGAGEASTDAPMAVAEGNGAVKGRHGPVPTSGFQAVQITVSKCTNEKTNGVYFPAVPYNGRAVWHKSPSEDEDMKEEEGAEGAAPKSKDNGERIIYFSEKSERWYIGDAVEEGGFSFAPSSGHSLMPPLRNWHGGAVVEFQSTTSDGDINAPVALTELAKLSEVEPWEDQELCYMTMLKVLGNIAANPGEAKYFSLKIDNAAIQNKILKFNGARGYLEAVGFRENSGALALPLDRSAQAKMAHDMLQGYATEVKYQQIRKERHAKAAEESKKEADRMKYVRKPPAHEEGGGGGQRFGRGPQRGGG